MGFPLWMMGMVISACRTRAGLKMANNHFGMHRMVSATCWIPPPPAEEQENDKFVARICEIVRQGSDWDTLSLHVDSTRLTHRHIDQVLLRMQSLADAKWSLKFFHWAGHLKKVEHTIQSYCITIHILVRAKMFLHAQALLESIRHKHCEGNTGTVIFESLLNTYNSTGSSPAVFEFLVRSYAKARMFQEAMDTCYLMKNHGFVPSLQAWNTLLHVVGKSDQTIRVWKIYEEMLESRTYPNNATVEIMVHALCKEGALQKTIDLLDKIQQKRCPSTSVVNMAFIKGVMEEGRVEEGSKFLKRMLKRRLIPDTVAYALMVYGHCKVGDLKQALELHEEMVMKGLVASAFTYTALISGYCNKGRMQEARELMKTMIQEGLKPYDATYNSLIEGYCKVGSVDEGIKFQQEMLEEGLLPSVSACNTLTQELCKMHEAQKANDMLTSLLDKNFVPNEATYSKLIGGYCKEGNIREALNLYYEMEHKGLAPSIMTYYLLIRCLCKKRKLKEAKKLLSVMSKGGLIPSSFIYNTLIAELCEVGNTKEALTLYDEMIQKGSVPDSHTYALLVKAIYSHNERQNASEPASQSHGSWGKDYVSAYLVSARAWADYGRSMAGKDTNWAVPLISNGFVMSTTKRSRCPCQESDCCSILCIFGDPMKHSTPSRRTLRRIAIALDSQINKNTITWECVDPGKRWAQLTVVFVLL
eukprot:Gb_13926 [translate_table: standard]